MQVEEVLDEEEYRKLLGDLTFDISEHSNSQASLEILDFEEAVESFCYSLEVHQLDHPIGTIQLASKVYSPCTTTPIFHCAYLFPQTYHSLLTPLEAEFLDRVSSRAFPK